MRRFAYVLVGAGTLALAGQALAQETDSADFTATAQTEPALLFECPDNLRFGTLAVRSDNAESVVTINAAAGHTGTISGTGVVQIGTAGPARCTVTNAKSGTASAALTTSNGLPSAFQLLDGTNTLDATAVLDKTTVADSSDVLYIGGTVTIPAGHSNHGVQYLATVTLTVTD